MDAKLKEMLRGKEALYVLLLNSFKRVLGRNEGASGGKQPNDVEQPESLNPYAFISANQRLQEIEAEKAAAISMSRHDRWKAGGPL